MIFTHTEMTLASTALVLMWQQRSEKLGCTKNSNVLKESAQQEPLVNSLPWLTTMPTKKNNQQIIQLRIHHYSNSLRHQGESPTLLTLTCRSQMILLFISKVRLIYCIMDIWNVFRRPRNLVISCTLVSGMIRWSSTTKVNNILSSQSKRESCAHLHASMLMTLLWVHHTSSLRIWSKVSISTK